MGGAQVQAPYMMNAYPYIVTGPNGQDYVQYAVLPNDANDANDAMKARGVSHPQIINQNTMWPTSGFEMCFAIGSRHQWCKVPGVPTKTRLESRFCNKEV